MKGTERVLFSHDKFHRMGFLNNEREHKVNDLIFEIDHLSLAYPGVAGIPQLTS